MNRTVEISLLSLIAPAAAMVIFLFLERRSGDAEEHDLEAEVRPAAPSQSRSSQIKLVSRGGR